MSKPELIRPLDTPGGGDGERRLPWRPVLAACGTGRSAAISSIEYDLDSR